MRKKKPVYYTVEREFLNKITVKEFIDRMVKSHVKEMVVKDGLT